MAGCGEPIEISVPRGYSYKLITVWCGDTSPYGDPWLCMECEEANAHRNWRQEAEMNGEQWDDDY